MNECDCTVARVVVRIG